MIDNLKTTWSSKNPIQFLISSAICFKMQIIFQNSVDNVEIQQKKPYFKLGCSSPLNTQRENCTYTIYLPDNIGTNWTAGLELIFGINFYPRPSPPWSCKKVIGIKNKEIKDN